MKKMIACVLIMLLLLPTVVVSAGATTKEDLETLFFDYCGGADLVGIPEFEAKVKIYDYVEADGITYFTGAPCWMAPGAMECLGRFGDWCVYSTSYNYPYTLAFYVMKDSKIYTLKDAWDKGIVTDLSPAVGFSEYTYVYPVGDADLDFEISVMDATLIQMIVAKTIDMSKIELFTVADIDQDKELTVMDATAIQLKIAKK